MGESQCNIYFYSYKEYHGLEIIGVQNCRENIIVYQRPVPKLWENYITEVYDQANRRETWKSSPKRK